MSRLSNAAIAAALEEDHTCEGCDRDRMDCACCHVEEGVIDLFWHDYASTEVKQEEAGYGYGDEYDPDDLAYLDSGWEWESAFSTMLEMGDY